jgi:hypothetical protein
MLPEITFLGFHTQLNSQQSNNALMFLRSQFEMQFVQLTLAIRLRDQFWMSEIRQVQLQWKDTWLRTVGKPDLICSMKAIYLKIVD